jgi:hypothetical protein
MNLRSLSDTDLQSRIEALTGRERETTLQILLHLAEIERRRLHLTLGFRSMFHYCTAALRYSESGASRRIQASRCVSRFPDVYDMLARGDVNLSTVSRVSRVLTEANKRRLLHSIRGKSQREVEGIVAELEPEPRPRDRVRTVVVRVPATALEAGAVRETEPACSGSHETRPSAALPNSQGRDVAAAPVGAEQAHTRYGGKNSATSPRAREVPARTGESESADSSCWVGGTTTSHTLEKRVHIQFSATPAFMAKLERVRSVAWHRLPAGASLERVFELALDEYLSRCDPLERNQQREQRRRRNVTAGSGGAGAGDGVEGRTNNKCGCAGRSRHIPAAVRDAVFTRDGGACTYAGPDGRRCGSTSALQIDHVVPFAAGGEHEPGNLRVLCAFHNRLEAERLLGGRKVERTGPSGDARPGQGVLS